MVTSWNRVILTGKVATPPQRHYRPDGSPVVQFPLELNHAEDQSGQRSHQKSGPFDRSLVNIVAFGELAESNFDLLQSGLHLRVVGRLNQRHWQTPEGKKRTRTEIIAINFRKVEEPNNTTCMPKGRRVERKRGEEDEETG